MDFSKMGGLLGALSGGSYNQVPEWMQGLLAQQQGAPGVGQPPMPQQMPQQPQGMAGAGGLVGMMAGGQYNPGNLGFGGGSQLDMLRKLAMFGGR